MYMRISLQRRKALRFYAEFASGFCKSIRSLQSCQRKAVFGFEGFDDPYSPLSFYNGDTLSPIISR